MVVGRSGVTKSLAQIRGTRSHRSLLKTYVEHQIAHLIFQLFPANFGLQSTVCAKEAGLAAGGGGGWNST